MIPGSPTPAKAPLIISERARVHSEHDGIWYPDPLVRAGDYVRAGTSLGYITDYHGEHLTDISAPESGVLLILFATPPVNIGDNIVVIGKIPD